MHFDARNIWLNVACFDNFYIAKALNIRDHFCASECGFYDEKTYFWNKVLFPSKKHSIIFTLISNLCVLPWARKYLPKHCISILFFKLFLYNLNYIERKTYYKITLNKVCNTHMNRTVQFRFHLILCAFFSAYFLLQLLWM